MKLNTESVARASSRRPWLTVGLWVVLVAVAGYLSSAFLSDALTTDVDFTDKPEARQGMDLVEERLRDEFFTELVLVEAETATGADPEFAA